MKKLTIGVVVQVFMEIIISIPIAVIKMLNVWYFVI